MMYYYGCWQQAGHFMHEPGGATVRSAGPFGNWIDGYFPPATSSRHHATDVNPYQDESLAALIHTKGWTVLAMWDRSLDTRYACNATFLIEGEHTTAEMWALARQHYPQIVARLKAAPKGEAADAAPVVPPPSQVREKSS